MAKINFKIATYVLLITAVLFSCQKKGDMGIGAGYKEEVGTGGNPFKGPTVTGTPTSTNPASKNSALQVGGSGWSNPSCITTQNIFLKGINGTIEVTLNFFGPPVSGSYQIGEIPTGSQVCSMVVNNAPNQPIGTVWYGRRGTVTVITTPNSITATFTEIVCVQKTFDFPSVSVSGQLGCN